MQLLSVTPDRWVGLGLAIGLTFGVVWLAFGFATTDVYFADLWREHSYWPLVYLCVAASLVGIVLLGAVERSAAALLPALGIFALIAFGPAAVICTAAVGWAAYILGEIIVWRAPGGGGDPPAFFLRLALGLLVLALVFNVAIAFPIHDGRIYSVTLLALVCARWRATLAMVQDMRAVWSLCRTPLGIWSAIALIAIVVLACVQIVEAALPERQHDALSFHLVIAQTVKTTGQWHFAGDFLALADQAIAADWLFSMAFVVAGERGAKLLNYVFFVLAAAMVHTLMLQRFGRGPAAVATLVTLSSPFTFLEAAGVSLDSFLLMAITTCVTVCGLWSKLSPRERILSSAVLLGGLPTVKLHGVFAAVAYLVLLLTQRIWRDLRTAGFPTVILGFTILALGAVPFAIAFAVTGNPVFPYFNAFFASPYFDNWNFTAPYPPDLSPSILHRLTFHTSRQVQGTDGSFGFQFVVFLIPGIIATLARPTFLSVGAMLITLIYSIGVLSETADARYFYPIFPGFSVVIAQAIFVIQQLKQRALATAALTLASVVAILNFLYFPGARWTLLPFDPMALFDSGASAKIIMSQVPQRLMIDHINNAFGGRARVAFIGQPVGFPLWGTVLFANWYMPRVRHGMLQATTEDQVADWLTSLGATHVIISADVKFANVDLIRRFLSTESKPLMAMNGQTLFEIPDDIRFKTVFSPVGSWDKWTLNDARVSPEGVRLVPAQSITFATPRLTGQQRQIRLAGRAVCANEPGEVLAQLQWHFANGAPSAPDVKSLPCANGGDDRFSAEFDRPYGAADGTVSLTAGAGAARISDVSVTTTEITIPEPVPLFRRDWAASPVWAKLNYMRVLVPDWL